MFDALWCSGILPSALRLFCQSREKNGDSYRFYYTRILDALSGGVGFVSWIVVAIKVPIDIVRIPHRIGLAEPSQARRVAARAIEVEPCLGIEALACEEVRRTCR